MEKQSKWNCQYWPYEWHWIPKFYGPMKHPRHSNTAVSTIRWLCFDWSKRITWRDNENF